MIDKEHLTFDELVAMLPTPGWTAGEAEGIRGTTLEVLVKSAHEKYQKGEGVSIIQRIENEIYLDLPMLQKLWIYLGLPV